MIYKSEDAEVIFQTDDAIGKKVSVINNCEYVRLSIDPGSVIPSHVLNLPVTFYIIAGAGTITLNEESNDVKTGDMIEIKPGIEREWTNTGENKLELLVIKHI